jgi:hypothetical protein
MKLLNATVFLLGIPCLALACSATPESASSDSPSDSTEPSESDEALVAASNPVPSSACVPGWNHAKPGTVVYWPCSSLGNSRNVQAGTQQYAWGWSVCNGRWMIHAGGGGLDGYYVPYGLNCGR